VKSVLLRLEGPLQSWATQSKFEVRDTDLEPSKSAILGLVGSAFGMERDDDVQLAILRKLSAAMRVDRQGSVLRDYHTAGGGRFRGATEHGKRKYFVYDDDEGRVGSNCIPSQRYYLQDAAFTVALSGDDDLVERVASALRSPRWPLYLGRRACVPSCPVLLGVVDGSAHEAVRNAPLADRRHPVGEGELERLRLIVEAPPEDGGEPRYDEPLSFRMGAKRYGVRYVKTEWMDVPSADVPSATAAPARPLDGGTSP
jgi:CRISPR system Cascade subunit CasD